MQSLKWYTGSHRLSNTKLEISIYPNAMYAERGDVGWIPRNSGLCTFKYNSECGLYEIVTEWMRRRGTAGYLFVKGHEEGHAILLLGQSERLFNALKERGYVFDFFRQDRVKELDRIAMQILDVKKEVTQEDLSVLGTTEQRDLIANCGSLIAFLQNGIDSNNLDYIVRRLQKEDPRSYYPRYDVINFS